MALTDIPLTNGTSNLLTLTKATSAKILKMYTKGSTIANVADFLEVSVPTARRLLVAAGAKIRPRGTLALG